MQCGSPAGKGSGSAGEELQYPSVEASVAREVIAKGRAEWIKHFKIVTDEAVMSSFSGQCGPGLWLFWSYCEGRLG